MSPQPTLDRLDQLIWSRSILKHPFYQAWQRGELSSQQLAVYARAYYPHVAAFPGYLEAALEIAEDPQVRAELQRNLQDELSKPQAHPDLWLDFAECLGLEREEVKNADRLPAVRQLIATLEKLASTDSASGLAALYAYESQQPGVSRQKADGLRRFYGIQDERALAYFEVHAEADLQHRAGERVALARCLDSAMAEETILEAASQTLDAYWGLLTGICEQAGIPVDC
jgi:pyrroloquinoline-quinone synthase